MKTGLCFLAFLVLYGMYLHNKIKKARKKRKQQNYKDNVVVARFKKEENGLWVCKFFLCGERMGYLEKQPRGERIKAVVVGYNEKNKLFKLEEFVED